MKIKIFIVLGLIFVLLFGCKKTNQNNNKNIDAITNVSLRQEWFPYSGYAGEIFAVNEFDTVYGIKIKLEAGADNIDPVKLVLSGQNTFGVVSADRILTSNEKGADLVAIGVVNYRSPTCFIAREEKNIKSPKDFEGKIIGILTGTNTEYVYQILIKKTNIDRKKIKEIEIPFDLGTFISNNYDVRPAFIYDEPVSLDLKGIKYSIIDPSDYGVSFLGTVYFTTRKTIKENPVLVQAFVNAIADGWKAAFNNPEKAISYLKLYDNTIDEHRELLAFKKGIKYFSGENGQILFADIKSWQEMANDLKELGVLHNSDVSESVDNSFIEKYNLKNAK